MAEEALASIHSLFKETFIQNCKLDEDEVNESELETLETLEPEEVYENLKELLTSLISFKKSIKNSEVKELTQRLVVFEKLIQKLESDIRTHISVEHQMRLDMESYEYKIEELQKLKQYHIKKIEDLDKMLVDKESEILHVKNKNALEFELKLKEIEDKFKQETCSAVNGVRKNSTSASRTRGIKGITIDKVVEKKIEEINFKESLSGKARKNKFPKTGKDSLTERAKRTKKGPSFVAELFNTLESMPKKERKQGSPYIKKESSHVRSASDAGLQKQKLTIL